MSEKREIINDVTTIAVNGREYSAIVIGPEASGVPKHILQSERKDGIIVDGESISPFSWKGVTKDDTYQYVYFDKCNLEPIETITTVHREDALVLIKQIAFGLMSSDPEFLNMATGVFPLYRIYILDKKKIVLLPTDMGDLIQIARMGERREKEANYLIKRNSEKGFLLIQEMAELMYWAITGRLPYENKDVRTCDYNEVPLQWYENALEEKTAGFVNFILHAKERQMRDIAGNRSGKANLSWFLKRTEEINWNLKNKTIEDRENTVKETENREDYKKYFEKIEKKANRRNFWRVKGTIILSLAAVLLIAGIIAGTILNSKFEAPYTKDMDQIEIVEDFFVNMNNIDPTRMDNNAIKATIPQYNAVISLFVNKQTRSAYEMKSPAVELEQWLADGKPAVPESSFIYGADITSITEIGENKLRASGIWYSPYSESEESEIEAPEGYMIVYKYDVDEDFTFSWSKRGWWVVDDIEITKYDYLGYELVEVYNTPTVMEKMLSN